MTNKFIPGQKVVRKTGSRWDRVKQKYTPTGYGHSFTVHICENGYVFDLYLNKFPESDCVDESSYNSPLWRAMQEED